MGGNGQAREKGIEFPHCIGVGHWRREATINWRVGADGFHSSLVYVEGDATMNTYQDAEGKNRSSLSIIERKFLS